jgi:hypothetical protein
MSIITLAFALSTAVEKFLGQARRFYYLVMLFGYRCPKCSASLTMVKEGRCRCDACRYEFDPTLALQTCSKCGGVPVLKVRRYQCSHCGSDIESAFLFDGIVFNAEYFRRKVAESRQRKQERTDRVRKMLAQCRSGPLTLTAAGLDSVPGLIEALNGLTSGVEADIPSELKSRFDIDRYQSHIRSALTEGPVRLREIDPLVEDLRLDLIWRFVAVVFLTHIGSVDIRQQGQAIWVMNNDDREGQDIPGEVEEFDGCQRDVGRTQAW